VCYEIKWNGSPSGDEDGSDCSYRERRPIFPLDVIPGDAPLLDLEQTAEVKECAKIPFPSSSSSTCSPLQAKGFVPYVGYAEAGGSLVVSGAVGPMFCSGGASPGEGGTQTFSFELSGVDTQCCTQGADSNTANSCGIHIHDVTSTDTTCEIDAGGHFYDSSVVDPWTDITYSCDAVTGKATGTIVVTTEKPCCDLVGRAVIVHDYSGDRISCAKLELIFSETSTGDCSQLVAGTDQNAFVPYYDYSGSLAVTGSAGPMVCEGTKQTFSYQLSGIDPRCCTLGVNAQQANSCGIHIHTTRSCSADAGNHFYDSSLADPWTDITYSCVSSSGTSATGVIEVTTGVSCCDLSGRSLIIHDYDGDRIGCSILESPYEYARFLWWDFETLSGNEFLKTADAHVVSMPGVNALYAYSYPYSWSANTGREVPNTVTLFFAVSPYPDCHLYHFYIVDKAWDGTGGDYKMTLSGMPPTFDTLNYPLGAGGDPSVQDAPESLDSVIRFFDKYHKVPDGSVVGYENVQGVNQPTATRYTGYDTAFQNGRLPIMLRDDPWNKYRYNSSNGRYDFTWHWLECCTDGVIFGPMPSAAELEANAIGMYNVTYEADLKMMVDLPQGHRISMWAPLGSAYTKEGAECAESVECCEQGTSQWIHYDVPMSQSGHETCGIQITGELCATFCTQFTDCGTCTAQLHCGWTATGCASLYASSTDAETTYLQDRTCTVCSGKTTPYDCMCEPGCGWAPFEMKCISGTPDYPSDQNVTVVQWETKGCTDTQCEPLQPRSQCYRAAYNEKHAFASIGLLEEYAVQPATSLPYGHILNKLTSASEEWPAPTFGVEPQHYEWFTLDSLDEFTYSTTVEVESGVSFYAYGYPNAFASNTGYEDANSMVTFMVQDMKCLTYLLVLMDSVNGPGGCVGLDIDMSGGDYLPSADPIIFNNDLVSQGSDTTSFDTTTGKGSVSLYWDAGTNDGLVLGPLPMSADWKVNMKVSNTCSDGAKVDLDSFKFGSYDHHKNEVGFVTANIKKATDKWGGLEYEAMECTQWCQRYGSSCDSCIKDSQCQFSVEHGGCIAADAYIYTFYCPRPQYAPVTKLMYRESLAAYDREAFYDNFGSANVIRYSYDSRLDMSCPCNSRYRYEATVYEYPSMTIALNINSTAVRLDYDHTFVDFPAAEYGKTYHIYSYICIDQGTLSRDDCSPVKVDAVICNVDRPGRDEPGCVSTGEVHHVEDGMFEVS